MSEDIAGSTPQVAQTLRLGTSNPRSLGVTEGTTRPQVPGRESGRPGLPARFRGVGRGSETCADRMVTR